ncbi:MAG TPA: phosphate ABC transporter permease subunit PstC [Anaerolineaceae bacterium]|nr:phosphate ABC transporter permease subunit PstC [Anaerolineaceae bacterium]HPN52731.1 phosphate ABC transporter permease subunit PstC [Anaerolineaceae bacterium]
MNQTRNLSEKVIIRAIQASGYSSILFVIMIVFFLLSEGLPALTEVPISSLLNSRWYPIEALYGILPLFLGSIVVTLGSTFISVPFGIITAVFLSEVAPKWAREILKPLVEILAGLPSVMLGFLGILVLSPLLREFLNLPTGLTAFTGSLLLGGIAVPTIVSIAEDALGNVPQSYRQAALALGATRWQTIWGVTVPAARSGILTAIMLGVGRAMGETMTVMMVTGNAALLPTSLQALFMPIRTMTATIASEMGEVAKGSTHYHILFLIGIFLFVISLAVNITATVISRRNQTRAERILS